MEDLIKEVLTKNRSYSPEEIELRPYCIRKMSERQIDKDTVISALFSNNLFYVEIQKDH